MIEKPLVIIGSGLAAYLFAKEFRKLNQERRMIIVTMSDGRFYSKPLLSTALTHQKSIDELSMSDAPAMSKQLSADIQTQAKVTDIDPQNKVVTCHNHRGEVKHEYGDLVIACGADKLHPPLAGDGIDALRSVNAIEDYALFRQWLKNKKNLVILGAGLVGCEFANDLINTDYQVTVVAPEQHPLARFVPEPVGQMLVGALAEKGVQWKLGHFAKKLQHDGYKQQLILDNKEVLHVDGVMSAIGLRPKLDLAKSARIKTNRGIVVDSQLRTSDPNIYALGDCAEVNGEVRQYVASLLQSARTLAKVLNHEAAHLKYPIMPIVIKTPACPIVTVPPPADHQGELFYKGAGLHLKAECKNSDGRLLGFVLVGDTVR